MNPVTGSAYPIIGSKTRMLADESAATVEAK